MNTTQFRIREILKISLLTRFCSTRRLILKWKSNTTMKGSRLTRRRRMFSWKHSRVPNAPSKSYSQIGKNTWKSVWWTRNRGWIRSRTLSIGKLCPHLHLVTKLPKIWRGSQVRDRICIRTKIRWLRHLMMPRWSPSSFGMASRTSSRELMPT